MAVRGHDGRPADCPLILGAGGDAVVDLDAVDGAGDPFSFAAYTVSAELLDTLGQSLSTPVTATVAQGAEPRLTFDGDELETLLDGRTRWSGSWRLLLDATPFLAGSAEVWHPGAGAVSTTDTISATVDATTVALTISSVVELGEGGGGVSDHGALTGLGDDDHTQYLLADGSRTLAGNLTVTGTVDGRDVAADGTKLDGIEASADVTDTANVTAAGALMDSEVTNLAQVKAFDSADYATAAQGSTADTALQPGADADDIDDTTSANKFTTAADVSKLAGIEAGADVTDTANVTAAGALMDSEVTNLADVKAFDPADYEASGAVATHEADTTSVHGIVDTSVLAERQPGEPNGFEDRADCVLSFDNGTRTLTLTGTFTIWSDGNKYTKTSDSFVIADTEGAHFVYYDASGNLAEIATFDINLITRDCFVAFVYWDAANSVAVPWAISEQHGSSMSTETHVYLHNTQGTAYDSGLALTVTSVDGTGDVDDDARFAGAAGVIRDEDIRHTVVSHGATDTLPVLWREGAAGDWRFANTDEFPVIKGGSTAYWNEWTGATWQRTEAGNNDYVLAHIFAIPGVTPATGGLVAVMGQAEYATVGAARDGAASEIADLNLNGLPVEEFKAIGTLIFQTSTAYSNAVAARTRSTDAGDDYVDWRTAVGIGVSGSTVAWGDVTGTLANQVDLQAVLDAKANDADLTAHTSNTTTAHGLTIADVVVEGDPRLTDDRDPTAHAASHATAGADPIAPGDIGAAVATDLSDHEAATTGAHGLPDPTTILVDGDVGVTVAAASDLSDHEADTTSVHGITDTSALLDTSATLDSLSGVDTDKSKTPADGDVLTFDGTDWNAEAAAGGGGSSVPWPDVGANHTVGNRNYAVPGWWPDGGTTRTLTTDRRLYLPFFTPVDIRVTDVYVDVRTAAGTVIRIGIVALDGDLQPNATGLIGQTTVDPSTTGEKTVTSLTWDCSAGLYAVTFVADSNPEVWLAEMFPGFLPIGFPVRQGNNVTQMRGGFQLNSAGTSAMSDPVADWDGWDITDTTPWWPVLMKWEDMP